MAPKLRMSRGAYVLLAALALVLLWTHSMDVKVKKMRARTAAAAAQAQGGGATAPQPSPGAQAPAPAELASGRGAPWGDDPFWKTSVASPAHASVRRHAPWKPSGKGLRLTGILWAGTEAASTAQICDQVVRVGQTAYGWTVLRISPNSVTLADRGAVITLKLNEDEP